MIGMSAIIFYTSYDMLVASSSDEREDSAMKTKKALKSEYEQH